MTDDTPPDPLDELFDLWFSGAKPSLPWTVRWSQGGYDPVAGAWIASESWYRMLLILGWDPHWDRPPLDIPPRLASALCAQLKTCTQRELLGLCQAADWWSKPKHCVPCATAIRCAVTPPTETLAELLAKTQEQP